MRRLFRSVVGLFRLWWTSDRIRVSAREGRLLRLAPGGFVRVAGEPAQVVSRQIARCADGPFVAYCCESASGALELSVRLASTRTIVRLRQHGRERQIAETEVEVIPSAGVACSRRSSS